MGVTEWAETPVVNNSFDQVNASLSGSRAVWQDYRNKASGCPSAQNCLAGDIYTKDLATGIEQRLTTSINGLDPDVSGDLVVWRNWDTGKIVGYDLFAGTSLNISSYTSPAQQVTPAVSGSKVVWIDYRQSVEYGEVYMRDLAAPADEPVALGDTGLQVPQRDKRNPDIDGNIVVWEDWRNAYQDAQGWWHNPDIYAKNVSTGVEYAVCTNVEDQYSPTVSGNKVFWQDYRNGNWDIYMKDLSTGVETRVTTSAAHQSWPSADGDFVTWKDTRNVDEDIYLKRISTGSEQMINSDPAANPSAAQKIPVISGTTIVWIDKRDGNWDVYSAEDNTAPQILSAGPSGTLTATGTSVSATFADGGTGVDTGSVVVVLDGATLAGCAVTGASVDCTVSGLGQGPHTYTVSLSDLAGNDTSGGGSFTVDNLGPGITNLSPAGWIGTAGPTVSADYSDPSGVDPSSVQVMIDGAALAGCLAGPSSVSCPASGLSEGGHTLTVEASDMAGNSASVFSPFNVDTQAPVVSPGGPIGTISSAAVTITASFNDPDPGSGIDSGSLTVSLDGAALGGCTIAATQVSCPVSNLGEGKHDVDVAVSDNVAHSGAAAWSFDVQNAYPLVSNLLPAPGSTVNNPWPEISASYADNGRGIDSGSIRLYLDGQDVTTSATQAPGSISYKPGSGAWLANGAHTARFVVADSAGGVSDQTWGFNVTSPSLTLSLTRIFWASYDDFLAGDLSVDYSLNDPAEGACRNAQIAVAYATNGVLAVTPLPLGLGDIDGHTSKGFQFMYHVPGGVTRFRATTHVSCNDDGANLYWFPGPPPEGPAA